MSIYVCICVVFRFTFVTIACSRKTALELHRVKSKMKRQMEQMAVNNKFSPVSVGNTNRAQTS